MKLGKQVRVSLPVISRAILQRLWYRRRVLAKAILQLYNALILADLR